MILKLGIHKTFVVFATFPVPQILLDLNINISIIFQRLSYLLTYMKHSVSVPYYGEIIWKQPVCKGLYTFHKHCIISEANEQL